MPYTRYSPEQKKYLKQHYHHLSNAELAHALGIDCPRKVLELARRVGVKWRAENGAPQWRAPLPDYPSSPPGATGCNTPNAQAHAPTRNQRLD